MKKKKPLVSIIMNCHNGEKYLEESLQSILKQTYKNWELIFWDNKSTDKSKKIISKYKNKKIKYFYSKSFHSLYKSRNLAVQKAKGKYITFLDTDDLWKKNKIEFSLSYLIKNKLKICYSNHYLYFQKIKKSKKAINYNFEVNSQFLLDNYNMGILTVILERSFFKKKLFETKYQIIGDFDYFIKMSLTNIIGYISKPLAVYRVHGSNYSIKNTQLYIKELSLWIQKNQKLMKKKNLNLYNQKKNLIKLRFKKIINYYKYIKKL
jgi:glycosyltransferase involved in cell wall biosynthesis